MRLRRKLESRQRDRDMLVEALRDPSAFEGEGVGPQRDEQGMPTHDASGEVLGKGRRKKIAARLKKGLARHKKAQARVAEQPTLLADMQQEIDDINAQLAELAQDDDE